MPPCSHPSGFVRCGCSPCFCCDISMSRGWFSGQQTPTGSPSPSLLPSLTLQYRQYNFRADRSLTYALQMAGILVSVLRTMAVCSKLRADKGWRITEGYYQVNQAVSPAVTTIPGIEDAHTDTAPPAWS